MSELKINKNQGMSDHAIKFEIEKLSKSISTIGSNIAELKEEYDKQMCELAKERNYDPWCYATGAVLTILFLFKRTFSSFFLLAIFAGLVVIYKKFLHKEKRVIEIKQEFEPKIDEQNELLAKRQQELKQYE